MTSILLAAGTCLLVPGLVLLILYLNTKDIPDRAVPQVDRSLWGAEGPQPGGQPIPDLTRSYRWLNIALLPCFFLLLAAFTLGWSYVLILLYRQRIDALPPSAYLVEPGWGLCVTPALFLGIFTSVFPLNLIAYLALRGRQEDYEEWERGRLGLGQRNAVLGLLLFLALVIVVPLTAVVALGMDWYTRFGEDEIAVNGFWGVGERAYPYGGVRRLVKTARLMPPSGVAVTRDRYFILFDDGTRWCNEDVVQTGPHLERDAEIMAFVSRKTGLPIEELDFIEDAGR
jgi:hypothetical protein